MAWSLLDNLIMRQCERLDNFLNITLKAKEMFYTFCLSISSFPIMIWLKVTFRKYLPFCGVYHMPNDLRKVGKTRTKTQLQNWLLLVRTCDSFFWYIISLSLILASSLWGGIISILCVCMEHYKKLWFVISNYKL